MSTVSQLSQFLPLAESSAMGSRVREPSLLRKRQHDETSSRPSKRRDTDPERQRVEHSCDRCRLRKRRCIRARENAPCVSCEEAGTECAMTLPRRQRIYATVDQLSLRYRVLDSLIKGLFPDHDVGSLQGLVALAEEKGIEIPRDEGRILPMKATTTTSLSPIEESTTTQSELGREGSITPPLSRLNLMSSSNSRRLSVNDVPEGWLVPAPKGGFHYVGTASLVYFAQTARALVSKCHLTTSPSFDETGLRRFLGAAEFTTYKASHTIEAKLQGHPLTVAAEEQDHSLSSDLHAPEGVSVGISNGDLPYSPASSSKGNRPVRLSDHLPDRPTADRLVCAFFNRLHPNFAVFHQAAFLFRYESTFSQLGDTKALSNDPGWVSTLQMVFVLGAQALEAELGAESYAIQQKILLFFFRDCLERIVLATSLSSVQALMLLALYQHNSGERNSAWLLLGHAARAAVGLGMHRDGENSNGNLNTHFDPFERQTRRLVWWTLHMFEGFVSLALGRPSFTDSVGTTVSLPESTFTERLGHPNRFLEYSVRLSDMYTNIRRLVGRDSVLYDNPVAISKGCDTVRALLSELSEWRSTLPSSLFLSAIDANPKHRRSILLLHTWACYLESVVTRPYHLARVHHDITKSSDPTTISTDITFLANSCLRAAHSSVNHLLELARYGLLEGSVYLDFYTVQHAAMIISLHFLSRPSSTTEDAELKVTITQILARTKSVNLAPTYKIIMNVAMQLAYIAGIGPTDEDLQPTPTPPSMRDYTLPSHDFVFPQPPSMLSASSSSTSTNLFPKSILPQDSFETNTNLPMPALEQLFGPMPPSRHNSAPDVFADLYNLGLDTSTSNPWDFFDVGSLTETLLQQTQHDNSQGTKGV